MAETETADPGQAFAALMSGAAEQAASSGGGEAPFGWTQDKETGQIRPKKAAGRPRKSPGLDELMAQRAEQATEQAPVEGRPADQPPSGKGPKTLPNTPAESVPYHPGRIARGMAKWYRRIGRFWKIYRPATGQAFIDGADDIGQAWEDVARGNAKIRKVLNWIVSGGNWGALVLAHAPIFAAMAFEHEQMAAQKFDARELARARQAAEAGQAYQPRDYRPFPMLRWLQAFAEDTFDSLPDTSDDGETLAKGDMGDMMKMASAMMGQLGFVHPDDLHPSQVPGEVIKEAAAAATASRPVPQDHKPSTKRVQPHRATRAKRRAA